MQKMNFAVMVTMSMTKSLLIARTEKKLNEKSKSGKNANLKFFLQVHNFFENIFFPNSIIGKNRGTFKSKNHFIVLAEANLKKSYLKTYQQHIMIQVKRKFLKF